MFEYIDIEKIKQNLDQHKKDWNSKKPFRYLSFENFFFNEKAELINNSYPNIDEGVWDNTTYINQKNKFQKSSFEKDSLFDKVFKELNHPEFLQILSEITGIYDLIEDEELFGGGLHQSITGAFLDVHVDYNIHPKTKLHRMLNVLVYMNKEWKDEYEGHLELWDMDKNERLERISPNFNRLAMFETNQISYHGHPHPLKSPKGISRKSIATYYYTKSRDEKDIADEHNTKYVNTTGSTGKLKNIKSGLKALIERIKK